MRTKNRRASYILAAIAIGLLTNMFHNTDSPQLNYQENPVIEKQSQSENELSSLDFDGNNQVIEINSNRPTFSAEELTAEKGCWQTFSDLDSYNRVGEANAVLGKEFMPTEEREPLYVNPSGWKQKKLSNNQWLYNRSHLIGFQLTGENNNLKNLMTGTRSFNTPYMLKYENDIAYYLKETTNHVRYRVRPVFRDDELVARGIQLEAQSIEENSLAFNVYIFNVQEGYSIDYVTGKASSM